MTTREAGRTLAIAVGASLMLTGIWLWFGVGALLILAGIIVFIWLIATT